jgi:ribosomal protein L30/L7E
MGDPGGDTTPAAMNESARLTVRIFRIEKINHSA